MPLGPNEVVLPEEVWQNIARHLCTRQWAAASGISPATFLLQVERVKIYYRISSAAAEWISKRWSAAHVMKIVDIRTADAEALANVVAAGGTAPARVQYLTMLFSDEPEDEEAQPCIMWLAWALAHMPRLVYLNLRLVRLLWVPPMLQLRHLSLSFYYSVSPNLASLRLLSNLRTLMLSDYYPRDNAGMELLDLRPLAQLERVCFENVRCAELHMGKQCSLHLRLTVWEHIADSDWSGALASVRSLEWGARIYREPIEAQLPVPMLQACNLSWLDLYSDTDVGSAGAPLALNGALVSISMLRITAPARSIYLHLPVKLALDELFLDAGKVLSVECNDTEAFSEGLRAFKICYKDCVGSFAMDLRAAMAARGMALHVEVKEYSAHHTCTRLQHRPPTAGARLFCFDCPCGCCTECLSKAGAVPADAC